MSHCTWTAAICVYFQVNRKDQGSTSVIAEKGLKQNKTEQNYLKPTFILLFLTHRRVFFCVIVSKGTGSCHEQLLHVPGY